ncbi:MAG: hypothetical protein NVSMB4_20370 [Acidimicrobiales bacterium]
MLILSTMLYADEVVGVDRLEALPAADDELVTHRELTMAQSLIDSLTVDRFDPSKFHDTYRQRVLDLIDAKAAGETVSAPRAVEAGARVVDLMAALEASVKAAKERRAAGETAVQEEDAAKGTPRKRATSASGDDDGSTDEANPDAAHAEVKPTRTRRRKSA